MREGRSDLVLAGVALVGLVMVGLALSAYSQAVTAVGGVLVVTPELAWIPARVATCPVVELTILVGSNCTTSVSRATTNLLGEAGGCFTDLDLRLRRRVLGLDDFLLGSE